MLLVRTRVPTCLGLSFVLVVFLSGIQSRQQESDAAFPFSTEDEQPGIRGTARRQESWIREGFSSSYSECSGRPGGSNCLTGKKMSPNRGFAAQV